MTAKLPDPDVLCDCGGNYYTAAQVELTVSAAVAQERERCAKVAESMTADPPQSSWVIQQFIAAAIRGDAG